MAIGPRAAVALLAMTVAAAGAGEAPAQGNLPSLGASGGGKVRVRLTPVINDYVSGVAWTTMTEECQRIWRVEGIEISWNAHGSGPSADMTVPLVLDSRELQERDPRHEQDAFGITLFSGRTQRILVSIDRVRRLVAVGRKPAVIENSMVHDIAEGRLLGRVVAHELGHVLLLTTQHSSDGLMSASLNARTLGPLELEHFALSTSERARLATRFSHPDAGERRADASTATPPDPSLLTAPR